jgi:hypothetical protein
MNDLSKLLFERDLSLQEMEELGALLAASPEAAIELREQARAFYLGLGLPEPEPVKRGKGWLYGGAAGLALLLGLGYWMGAMEPRPERPDLGGASEAFGLAAPAAERPRSGGTSVKPMALPQSSADDTGDYLSVVVKRGRPGQVGVRILDASGTELRRLYKGSLEAGSWSFKWDGKLGDGRTAPQGSYSIEVDEDGRIRTKRVRMGNAP